MKKTNTLKTIILATFASLLLTSCIGSEDKKEKEWTSFVYPDKQNRKRSVKIGVYEDLQQCRQASKEKLIEIKAENIGFYKCGFGCTFHEGMKNDICKRMEK